MEVFIDNMQSNLKDLGHVRAELVNSETLSKESMQELQEFKDKQIKEGGMSMLEVVLRMIKHLNNYIKVTNCFMRLRHRLS